MSQEAKILTLVGVVMVVMVVGISFLMGEKEVPSGEGTSLIRENSYKIGSDSAKVKIVEFGDFQCPACKVAHPVVKKVVEDYKDKVQFVFRNFPLPTHRNAEKAALSAEAAGIQGKYWEMYDYLFSNQSSWESLVDPKTLFQTYAKELSLDEAKFAKDLEDQTLKDKIKRDLNDGNSALVDSTPTFFINGEKFTSSFSYTNFKSKIDSLLD